MYDAGLHCSKCLQAEIDKVLTSAKERGRLNEIYSLSKSQADDPLMVSCYIIRVVMQSRGFGLRCHNHTDSGWRTIEMNQYGSQGSTVCTCLKSAREKASVGMS